MECSGTFDFVDSVERRKGTRDDVADSACGCAFDADVWRETITEIIGYSFLCRHRISQCRGASCALEHGIGIHDSDNSELLPFFYA